MVFGSPGFNLKSLTSWFRTICHVSPPSKDRCKPPLVATHTMLVLFGFIKISFIRLKFAVFEGFKPVSFHVFPPSKDLNTPTLKESDASSSPVAMYIMLELVGSIAIPETPICGKSSKTFSHESPASRDLHKPPAGAPANQIFSLLGSTAMALILPIPGCP